MPGNLDGERIGNGLVSTILVLDPGGKGQGHPHRAAVDHKLYIHGIGMASGHRNDEGLIKTVNIFLGPAVTCVKILIHGKKTISTPWAGEQTPRVFSHDAVAAT